MATEMVKKFEDISSRFDKMPAFHGRTDRRLATS